MSEELRPTMFLDTQTKKKALRCTAFTDNLEDILRDFKDWVELNHLTPKDIWYADVFALPSDKHTLSLILQDDGTVEAITVGDSELNPYKRNRLLARLRGWK